MAVFRVEHNKDYTVISNAVLRDSTLSEKALGLLVRVLSLPANWDFSVKGLSSICKSGYDGVKASLAELEELGYLKRNRIRDAKGQYDTEYVFYEEPEGSFQSGNSRVVNPQQ